MTDPDRPDYSASLTDFFDTKGAIELAFLIFHGGASFSQLEKETGLSSATLSKRLKQGEHLGLWHTIATRPNTGRSKQKYVGTQTGMALIDILGNVDYPDTYQQYNKAESELSKANAAFLAELEKRTKDGEISPPWEQPPEPSPEARESIGDKAILQNVSNPFDRRDMSTEEDSSAANNTKEIEIQIQQLINTYLDNHPRDISTEEILSQMASASNEDNDTQSM